MFQHFFLLKKSVEVLTKMKLALSCTVVFVPLGLWLLLGAHSKNLAAPSDTASRGRPQTGPEGAWRRRGLEVVPANKGGGARPSGTTSWVRALRCRGLFSHHLPPRSRPRCWRCAPAPAYSACSLSLAPCRCASRRPAPAAAAAAAAATHPLPPLGTRLCTWMSAPTGSHSAAWCWR